MGDRQAIAPDYDVHDVHITDDRHGQEFNFRVPRRFKDLTFIAQGAYGAVVSAIDTETNEQVAIKRISLTRPGKEERHIRKLLARTLREIKIIRALQGHENVMAMKNIFPLPNRSDYTELYLVSDLMDSDLKDVLAQLRLSGRHVRFFAYQLLRGVKFMHSAGILHRDLTARNILLSTQCDLKICDFGLSRVVMPKTVGTGAVVEARPAITVNQASEGGRGGRGGRGAGSRLRADAGALCMSLPPLPARPTPGPAFREMPMEEEVMTMSDYVVTRWYRAPEVMLVNGHYSFPIDIFAAGCLLAEMIIGKPIFISKSAKDHLKMVIACVPPDPATDLSFITDDKRRRYVRSLCFRLEQTPLEARLRRYGAPEEAIDLILRMLHFNPDKRPTAEECLQHPYFRTLHQPDDEPECSPVDTSDFFFEVSEPSLRELKGLMFDEVQLLRQTIGRATAPYPDHQPDAEKEAADGDTVAEETKGGGDGDTGRHSEAPSSARASLSVSHPTTSTATADQASRAASAGRRAGADAGAGAGAEAREPPPSVAAPAVRESALDADGPHAIAGRRSGRAAGAGAAGGGERKLESGEDAAGRRAQMMNRRTHSQIQHDGPGQRAV
eukprot:CAMPEP_0196778000 /NCGR_PEP_ID=MMETSP1104-20130614/5542_1 /TAXON_ID=33652 /ORGANISM="Cafeteria sp., Strain Caron Lab Isolate" /LENGTH=611 /DNA_ID=CAMNT_0042148167 /DNA_START=118 /DNA_END=1950 /DNA_ORIENTATION=-